MIQKNKSPIIGFTERLKDGIEGYRSSKELKFRILLLIKDILWFFSLSHLSFLVKDKIYIPINDLVLLFYTLKAGRLLSHLLKGKRVLIVASGLSSNDLKEIPKDVVILTCKFGIKLFADKNIRNIDVYLNYDWALRRDYDDIIDLFPRVKIRYFFFNNLKYIKSIKEINRLNYNFVFDSNTEYYLKKLIYPIKPKQIQGSSRYARSSAGMKLVQWALYHGAREIYIIGIDIDEGGYFWKKKNENFHMDIDDNFLRIVSKKYHNLYSASKRSPITRFIPYKELE